MAAPLSTADLGFVVQTDPAGPQGEVMSWRKRVSERDISFRLLRRLPDLLPVDALQRDVLGVSDLDLVAASELVVVSETGGDVIGAFHQAPGTDERLVGVAIGFGGYYAGRPRIVSDLLVVRGDLRSLGLGAELKRLQAAIALERGFVEMVWTVDPLRAANARLNFEKLGAYADRYEEDRYGASYATGLYGALPTDRLHVTWPLTSRRVRDRLRGGSPPLTIEDVADLSHVDPAATDVERALVYLPSDIDALLTRDPNTALHWRLTLRETLQRAFTAGFAITGFVRDVDQERALSAYVIERTRSEAGGRRLGDGKSGCGGR